MRKSNFHPHFITSSFWDRSLMTPFPSKVGGSMAETDFIRVWELIRKPAVWMQFLLIFNFWRSFSRKTGSVYEFFFEKKIPYNHFSPISQFKMSLEYQQSLIYIFYHTSLPFSSSKRCFQQIFWGMECIWTQATFSSFRVRFLKSSFCFMRRA